jgi:hypothetical protein
VDAGNGGIRGGGSRPTDIQDGLSKTIAMAEEVGRSETMPDIYIDPLGNGSTGRAHWRWAEPSSGFAINGNSASWANQTTGAVNPGVPLVGINNNKSPVGGGPGMSVDLEQLRAQRGGLQLSRPGGELPVPGRPRLLARREDQHYRAAPPGNPVRGPQPHPERPRDPRVHRPGGLLTPA